MKPIGGVFGGGEGLTEKVFDNCLDHERNQAIRKEKMAVAVPPARKPYWNSVMFMDYSFQCVFCAIH